MSEPIYLTRDEWGGRLNAINREMEEPATALWAHHSVTNEEMGVHATEDAIADFLELDALGVAGGISYSYAIHPNGIIGEGQGTHQGAHTGGNLGCGRSPWGWNPCSFGVCFIGDFHPREANDYQADELTDAAINSFRWLRDKLIREGDLVAGVYPTGGHRDASGNSTACPGDNIEARLDELRAPYAEPVEPAAQRPKDDDMPWIAHTETGDYICIADQRTGPVADIQPYLDDGYPVHVAFDQWWQKDRLAFAPLPSGGVGVVPAEGTFAGTWSVGA